MRNQWKRNAVVATVLLFVCAAVYLNWRYAGNLAAEDAAPASQQSEDGGSTKILGDATLVGGVPTLTDEGAAAASNTPTAPASSYFDTARLSRQQSRDNALSLLREAAGQQDVEQAALDEDGLQTEDVAKITDIVLSETEYAADQIKIMEAE